MIKLKIFFRKLNNSLKTVNTLSKKPPTLSPKLGSGSSTSITAATSVVACAGVVSETDDAAVVVPVGAGG